MDVLVGRGLLSDCRQAQPSARGRGDQDVGQPLSSSAAAVALGGNTRAGPARVEKGLGHTQLGGTSHCWTRRRARRPACSPCGGWTKPAEECSLDGGTRAGVCADGVPSSVPFPSLVEWVLSASLASLRPDPPSLVSGDLVTYSLLGMALISLWLCAFRWTGQHVF